MSATQWQPTVGGGATVCHYSDRTACTVIRISPSGKTVWMQEDTAVLDGWKPEFIPGGFSGHCVNNTEQRYAYQSDPQGAIYRASVRKDGKLRTTNGERVISGRHHFHDYNF
jgi:hypothetical protein